MRVFRQNAFDLRMFLMVPLMLLWAALPACAANKLAMVVGNNSYDNLNQAQQLRSAHNDANAVSDLLRSNGFRVFQGTDLSRNDFIQMLFDFTGALGEGDIAVFFYAGHGVSIDGANYLLPSDIPGTSASRRMEARRLASLSVHEQAVLSAMKDSGAQVSLAILDACRDNPLKNAAGRSIGATRGLQRMETIPQGTFSIYSAGYGQVALDRLPGDTDSANSVFTRVLLDKLAQPGMTVRKLALSTRAEVRQLAASAGHVQSPAYYDELGTAEPVLLTQPAEAARPAPARAGSIDDQIELMMIEQIKGSDDPAELQAYLDGYPKGRFAALARARLKRSNPDGDSAGQARKIKELKSARQADQMMIAALQKALEDSKSQVGALGKRAGELESQLRGAQVAKQDAEFETRQLQAQLDEAQSIGSDPQNGELAQELATAQQDLAAALQEVSASHIHIDALRTQLNELQAVLDDADERDAQNAAQLQALGSELNAALARAAAEERRRREFEEELAKAKNTAQSPLSVADLNRELQALIRNTTEPQALSVGVGDGIALKVSDLFASDGLSLTTEGQTLLMDVADSLNSMTNVINASSAKIFVIGYTDTPGSFETNRSLSSQRASSVAEQIRNRTRELQIDVRAVGLGEKFPVASNNTSGGRDRNRRIEVFFGKD